MADTVKSPGETGPPRCPGCGRVLEPEGGGLCPVCALEDAAAGLIEEGGLAQNTAPLALDDLPLQSGAPRRVGRYELHELVGAGGMGVVYRAWQTDLERWVAIKLLPPAWFEVPEARERFRQEALTLARLRHPNIVALHDFGESEGQPYLVMEYVEGTNLAHRTGEWLTEPEKVAGHVKAAADALQAAHQGNVLHRDLKPSNLLLDADDRIRITDFGLARPITGGSELTRSGQVLGTLAYVAPEQVSIGSRAATAASDVYSLGAVLFHLLTGRPPFLAGSAAALLQQVARDFPPAPSTLNPLVPRDLEVICLKCLQKEPRDRYASADELAQDLGRFLARQEIRARPLPWLRRARRWARSHRAEAAAAGLGLVLMATLGTGVTLAIRERMTAIRTQMAAAEEVVEREQLRAYAHQLAEAWRALAAQDPVQARQRLDATPVSLRGWEHRFLLGQPASDQRSWSAHAHGITAVAANATGDRIASGDGRGHVRVWDAASQQLLQHHFLHRGRVNSLRFSRDGRYLASSGADGNACVLETQTGTVLARHQAKAALNGAVFCGDTTELLTVGDHGRLEHWRGTTNGPPGLVLLRQNRLLAVDWHAGLKAYAAADDLGRVHVGRIRAELESSAESQETEDGAVRKDTWQAHSAPVSSLAWSPDGTVLASGAVNGQVHLWNPTSGESVRVLQDSGSAFWELAWSADGVWVAAATGGGNPVVWSADGTAAPPVSTHGQGALWSVAFLGSEHRLVGGGRDRHLSIWDVAPRPAQRATRTSWLTGVTRVRFAHSKSWFVAGGVRGELWCLDAGTGATNWAVRSAQDRISALAISGDDHWVVAGGSAGRLEVRSSGTGDLNRELTPGRGAIRALAFHPRGHLLAVGGDDRVLRVLDFETGQVVRAFPARPNRIARVAFSPDGDHVLCSGADQRLVVWPLEAADPANGITPPATVEDFDLASGGLVVTVSRGEGARFWRLPDLTLVAQTEPTAARLRAGALTPDGRRLVTTDDFGALQCWDVRTGIPLLHVPLLGAPMRDLRFGGRRRWPGWT
ncbi:MAG: protein kinase [Verrucomicrobiales bacterium]|nr:protein kinase [Verrucomicrobiales bacterium]